MGWAPGCGRGEHLDDDGKDGVAARGGDVEGRRGDDLPPPPTLEEPVVVAVVVVVVVVVCKWLVGVCKWCVKWLLSRQGMACLRPTLTTNNTLACHYCTTVALTF